MDVSSLYHQWFGIPPKDQPPNAYRLLGIELFETDPQVIEAAAEQRMLLLRARQYGPHSAQSQQMMNEVSRALRTLLTESARASYDDELRRKLAAQLAHTEDGAIPAEEIPSQMAAVPSRSTPHAVLPIVTATPSPVRHRRQQQSASPVMIWAGSGGGALVALLVLLAFLRSGANVPTQTAERTPVKPMSKSVQPVVATTSPAASAPDAAQPTGGEFQFQPVEQPEPPIADEGAVADENAAEAEDSFASEAVAVTDSAPEEYVSAPELEESKGDDHLEVAVAEPTAAEQPKARAGGEKRLLKLDDLKFLGAFKLPREACGQSTGYAAGCLALRHVNNRPRLFSDSHVATGGAVYEVDIPTLAKEMPYPTAEIVHEWGDIYQGRKQKGNGESYNLDGETPTTGLRWDEADQRLWWTYGQRYNTENQDAPTFGATRLKDKEMTAEGPWKLRLPQSWQRGGTLEIPVWFADKYTGGKRLGVGFGGYYSIFEGGSYGPTLSAAAEPAAGQPPASVTLLAYPDPHLCPRNDNYRQAAEGWMGKNPVNGRGTWNSTDEIGGEHTSAGVVWIDAPDKHGLLFFVSLGTGRIAYENGGIQCEGRENALYIYDPADLAKVAQRNAQPWSPVPKFHRLDNPAPGLAGRAAGVAYDAAARRLYVVFVSAYPDGEESYPVVVVYQI